MHGGIVFFDKNHKVKITGVHKISIHPHPLIDFFFFVEGLKHNLLSISQLCGNGNDVSFNKEGCIVQNKNGTKLFSTKRKGNLYKINLSELSNQIVICLLSIKENHWIRHNKLGHATLRLISKLQKHDLIKGLPRLSYKDDLFFEVCQKGKQVSNYFSSKNIVSTSRPLKLLHLDLFDPTRTTSASGKRYGLIVVDDYSRWT